MKLPVSVLNTRDRYLAAFPLWTMSPGAEAEDRARRWTIGLAEQIRYEHGPSYGNKRADPGRPISKDAIAYVPGILPWAPGEKLLAFDMLSGAGTGAPTLVPNPDAMDISDQVFVNAIPVDHLAGQPPEQPTPPPSIGLPPYPGDAFGGKLGDVLEEDYARAGQLLDAGSHIWSGRVNYDYFVFYTQGLDADVALQKSVSKHRKEWCDVLGIEVI